MPEKPFETHEGPSDEGAHTNNEYAGDGTVPDRKSLYSEKILRDNRRELKERGIVSDAVNTWSVFLPLAEAGIHDVFRRIQVPLKDYKTWVFETQPEPEEVLRLSNPEKVREFDALVKEFNNAVPQISADQNYAAIIGFGAKFLEVCESENAERYKNWKSAA